jgi:hypothetical protein
MSEHRSKGKSLVINSTDKIEDDPSLAVTVWQYGAVIALLVSVFFLFFESM